jgi:preprotein translocase subunit SecA
MSRFLERLRKRPIERNLRRYEKLLARINRREPAGQGAADLRPSADRLRSRAEAGESLDRLLPEVYALVREAARRTLSLAAFDVQVFAACAMHQGKLAEMQTGEGKTLAAVFPAFLNALDGRGVHVLTFNDYLARRDAAWMGPVYASLGLSVGHVQEGMDRAERRRAYAADVTYLTAKEAGFDFLRDQLVRDPAHRVHRPFHFAIVDEADSILVDEARVPMVIAGRVREPVLDPHRAREIVTRLESRVHFDTDEYERNVHLTDAGIDAVEAELGCENLHAAENLPSLTAVSLALQAQVLLRRDVDYIVRDGKIEVVDEFTGRVVADRRWPDGLQAAIEAKEGLAVERQGQILGSITMHHFLELYPKLAAMTATARSAAEELKSFFRLTVVVIPPHRPCVRVDEPDRVFTHKAAKVEAVVDEIHRAHGTGRPVLVGSASVLESEALASALERGGVYPLVLNAKNDEIEARIVAGAGDLGAVTIATNMAGRGTDIRLGGESEERRARVKALGGLYVIGTNRHESRRIDDQLRGRAGRQGDPGSSRFFVSLEDDLMVRYGIRDLIPWQRYPDPDRAPVEDPVVHREIARAQRIIEGQNFEIRLTLRRYSTFVEGQRRILQGRRREILEEKHDLAFLESRCPGRYAELRARFGEALVRRIEREITLAHIDRSWAEHLAQVANIRDGIHLESLGAAPPLDRFHERAAEAFLITREEIDAGIVHTFETASVTADGIDIAAAGLRGPSSTWTYLVNDTPFGSFEDRLFRGIVNAMKGLAGRGP